MDRCKEYMGGLEKTVLQFNNIVIFGCGRKGLYLFNILKNNNKNILAFTDNNKKIWNKKVRGKTVLSPKDVVNKYPDAYYCIAITIQANEIKQQLEGMGVKSEKIIMDSNIFTNDNIMNMSYPIISLCIPTNGVSEWVFPVLDKIYAQGVDKRLFEVVVTDNGDDEVFQSKMEEYVKEHDNMIYKKTDAYMFDNQIEALKIANGEYLKFINHRSVLVHGALQYFINYIRINMDDKPVIYFSNGSLNIANEIEEYDSFDAFVGGLKHIASWTTGVGIWRQDFERIPTDYHYDKISPHSGVLFAEKGKNKYIINDVHWMNEIETSHAKKGTYDLYKAFAVEELDITLGLYKNGDISISTFKKVREAYKNIIIKFYYQFNIKKEPCSYDLNGFDNNVGIFFNKYEIVFASYLYALNKIIKNICRR